MTELIQNLTQNGDASDLLAGVATIVGFLWAFFKGSEYFKAIRESRWNVAIDAVEAGVAAAYEEIVREAKQENGGKLTEEQRRAAQDYARMTAKQVAEDKGIKLEKVLTSPELLAEIEAAVNRAKASAKVTDA